jgi:hypothetical protein
MGTQMPLSPNAVGRAKRPEYQFWFFGGEVPVVSGQSGDYAKFRFLSGKRQTKATGRQGQKRSCHNWSLFWFLPGNLKAIPRRRKEKSGVFVPPQKDVFFHLTYEKIFIYLNIQLTKPPQCTLFRIGKRGF